MNKLQYKKVVEVLRSTDRDYKLRPEAIEGFYSLYLSDLEVYTFHEKDFPINTTIGEKTPIAVDLFEGITKDFTEEQKADFIFEGIISYK